MYQRKIAIARTAIVKLTESAQRFHGSSVAGAEHARTQQRRLLGNVATGLPTTSLRVRRRDAFRISEARLPGRPLSRTSVRSSQQWSSISIHGCVLAPRLRRGADVKVTASNLSSRDPGD